MKDNFFLPILSQHQSEKPIGKVVIGKNGNLAIEFSKDAGINRDMLFDIFGGAGIRVLESELVGDVQVIKRAEIIEFSLCEPPAQYKEKA